MHGRPVAHAVRSDTATLLLPVALGDSTDSLTCSLMPPGARTRSRYLNSTSTTSHTRLLPSSVSSTRTLKKLRELRPPPLSPAHTQTTTHKAQCQHCLPPDTAVYRVCATASQADSPALQTDGLPHPQARACPTHKFCQPTPAESAVARPRALSSANALPAPSWPSRWLR